MLKISDRVILIRERSGKIKLYLESEITGARGNIPHKPCADPTQAPFRYRELTAP